MRSGGPGRCPRSCRAGSDTPWWCCTRACERKHRVKKVANIALTLVDVKAPLGHVTHTPLQLLGGERVEVVDKRSLVRDLKVTNAAVTLPTKVNPVAGVHFMERGVLENAIGKSTLLGHQGVLVEVGALRSLLGGGGGGSFGHADGLHVVGDVRDVVVQLVGHGPKSGQKKNKFKGGRAQGGPWWWWWWCASGGILENTIEKVHFCLAPFTLAATSSWNPIGLNGHVACLNKSDSIWMWLRSDSG